MKNIKTLVSDIYQLVEKKDGWFTPELAHSLSEDIAVRLSTHFNEEAQRATLRLSKMGPQCPRALWHSVHTPELQEALPPWAMVKYSFGHVIEALAVTLAKAAGHTVVGEQDELTVDGVQGHRDCVIDGCVVDVKSTSSMGFLKFKDGSIATSDSFGYLDQLDGYLVGSLDDPLVTEKDKAYILAIDKTLGKIVLYEHRLREASIRERISQSKQIVALGIPPQCTCSTVPEGKSGNIRLDTKASYSAYKHCCFPKLRTFIYADGPRYLTHVERVPDVPELRSDGRSTYH